MDRRTITSIAGVGIVAAAAGLGAGSLIWRNAPASHEGEGAGEHAESQHEQGETEEAREGFVALPPATASTAGVEVTTVARGGGAELLIPGRAAFAPNAQAAVGAPLGGVVQRVHVAPGTNVRAGAPLVTIRSPEGASLNASADAARAEVEAAQAAHRRETQLYRAKVTARQDLEAARATSLKAQASLRAAQAQIAAVGSPGATGYVIVRSPMAGTITSLGAATGSVLAQGATVAQVADQNRVELIFEAPAGASRTIRIGSPILATMAGGEEIRSVVTAISPNAATAGAQVRARPIGFVPPAGTPVSGRVLTGAADTIVVPADAVQNVEGRSVVFVADGSGFRATPVVAGRSAAGRTEILKGLTGRERIAGRGAFLLKAELSKSEAEHEH
ncbi:efflux RND transporter periplasmic adaptor subunit [Sphingosinicella sp. BN140058]|uniref:efflux RND transporter periplasmic adaptor subunit n=1 Tax=Sphingosinicella sp. BN140058 TaxID=1892855 RepID=UPI001010D81B|nr:efflux RND transporter periplasmic adaptor subunit [Sphingosinicella sp. BN140058]QAY75318.1 efflux RND transporter periplasmic adaptor subunit [Sphingosinicella sp. BN140058]